MNEYKKKPVVIKAVKLQDSYASILECTEFIQGHKENLDANHAGERFLDYVSHVQRKGGITIPTLEGEMKASFGDYIIEGINGEHYPCKPVIFDKTYDKV